MICDNEIVYFDASVDKGPWGSEINFRGPGDVPDSMCMCVWLSVYS